MKNQIEVQLAWKLIEFLETLTNLIYEHYHDDLINDYYMAKLKQEQDWTQ